MSKILVLTAVLLACIAAPTAAWENCNGIGYFALQVPNPGSMAPDGDGSDWSPGSSSPRWCWLPERCCWARCSDRGRRRLVCRRR